MTVLADLHTHSTASDGQYRPAELVRMARDRGIEVLALTDHDTLAGLDEAVLARKELGVRVLRGVELSARERRTFHILSYGFDGQAPQLQALCRDVRQRREHRGLEIARYLAAKGAPVAISEVQELAGYGLCAIECFYPRYTDRQAALYRRLAQRFGLYYTGGSDFHGEQIKPEIQLKAVALELPWLPAQEEI